MSNLDPRHLPLAGGRVGVGNASVPTQSSLQARNQEPYFLATPTRSGALASLSELLACKDVGALAELYRRKSCPLVDDRQVYEQVAADYALEKQAAQRQYYTAAKLPEQLQTFTITREDETITVLGVCMPTPQLRDQYRRLVLQTLRTSGATQVIAQDNILEELGIKNLDLPTFALPEPQAAYSLKHCFGMGLLAGLVSPLCAVVLKNKDYDPSWSTDHVRGKIALPMEFHSDELLPPPFALQYAASNRKSLSNAMYKAAYLAECASLIRPTADKFLIVHQESAFEIGSCLASPLYAPDRSALAQQHVDSEGTLPRAAQKYRVNYGVGALGALIGASPWIAMGTSLGIAFFQGR